ncbi:MAG: OmpH family outer membrane protein [Candidatus Omnitrophica bacterium]|nr:OmpH family outer membrane protein [Candidatus Omnitrophota bacterium]
MKKLICILAAIGLMTTFALTSFAKDMKIGYVDFLQIYDQYEKTKEYDKALEAKKDVKEKELKAKAEEIEKMQSKASMLKDKEKDKEKDKVMAAAKDFENLRRQSYLDLKKERDEKMKEIVADIENVVKDYAKKNNYDLILNGNIIHYAADKSMDITSEVMKAVNDTYKK